MLSIASLVEDERNRTRTDDTTGRQSFLVPNRSWSYLPEQSIPGFWLLISGFYPSCIKLPNLCRHLQTQTSWPRVDTWEHDTWSGGRGGKHRASRNQRQKSYLAQTTAEINHQAFSLAFLLSKPYSGEFPRY